MTLTEFLTARLDDQEEAWRGGLNLQTRPDFSRLSELMLAQVAAMRAIVDLHSVDGMRDCQQCLDAAYPEGVIMEPWPCQTVSHLAAVWSSHPDYDPAWSPDA